MNQSTRLPLRYRVELVSLGVLLRFFGWAVYIIAFVGAMFIGGWTIPNAFVFVIGVWGGAFLTSYNRKRDSDPLPL